MRASDRDPCDAGLVSTAKLCRVAVPLVRPLGSAEGFDGCDRDQVLDGAGEVPVEGDQRVGVELGQGDVLGVKVSGHPSRTAAFQVTF